MARSYLIGPESLREHYVCQKHSICELVESQENSKAIREAKSCPIPLQLSKPATGLYLWIETERVLRKLSHQ